MLLNGLLFCCIGAFVYALVSRVIENKILEKINRYINEKNEKYYEEFLRNYEKNKKIKIAQKFNVIYKINLLIDKANMKRNLLVNPICILLYSGICVLLAYHLVFRFFKLHTLSLIVSLPCMFVPVLILSFIATQKEEKIEKAFLNFLLQIKNYTKISNDITSAFQEVDTVEPLRSYIHKFNIELGSGVRFETAIEHLKEKISIVKFRDFFSNLQYCYLYGGSFPELIDKNYRMIADLQQEKNKRLQETKSARLVLIILMVLNLYVYMTYIKSNYENYLIMQKSFFGMAILYWNFISMWGLLWFSMRVKKLDY